MRAAMAALPGAFRFAARSFRSRLLQTSLLIIALMASYAAASTLLAVLTSLRERVAADMRRVGWNVINVHPDPDPRRLLRSFITEPLLAELAAIAGGPHTAASLETTLVSATPEEETSRAAVLAIGTTPSWASITETKVIEGRFLAQADARGCVLDEWVARRLFGTAPAVGRTIYPLLGGRVTPLEVVGVLEDPFRIRRRFDTVEGSGAARSIVVRLMEYKNVYVLRETLGLERPILFGLLSAAAGVEPAEAVKAIRKRLADMGSTARAWDRKGWAQRILGATDEIAKLASFLWVAILAITALMAAAIIAIAVRGRYREIAIRRVEGGTRVEVLAQLLAENALITVAAAVPGFGIAALAALWLETSVLGWPIPVRTGDLALILASGLILAVVTTFLPARRAASLSPVQVLARS
jgi:ABC-type antimicrobial peptide transport system permease subunit